jgi:dTMP kinase
MKRGIFICFEGIDGAGKTTQMLLLKDWLIGKKIEVKVTKAEKRVAGILEMLVEREIGETNIQPMLYHPWIPSDLRALARAFDHALNGLEVVRPALQEGAIVMSDRCPYGMLVYQAAFNARLEWPKKILSVAPKPDLAFLLDLEPSTALTRIRNREHGNLKYYETIEFLTRIRDLFKETQKKMGVFEVIDASGDVRSINEEVRAKTLEKLRSVSCQTG